MYAGSKESIMETRSNDTIITIGYHVAINQLRCTDIEYSLFQINDNLKLTESDADRGKVKM